MTLTEALLAHAEAPARLPPSTVAAARCFLADTLAVAVAGAATPESLALQGLLADRPGEITVLGTGLRTGRDQAAMLNAFAIHALEYDCVHEAAVVHPLAVIVAALMADAEARGGVDGARFLSALIVGVEVATRIGRMARQPMRFFRPAQCGQFGAVAGLARLRGFDAGMCHDAMGHALCQLSGTLQAHREGLPGLALQMAFQARAALCSADLAEAGLPGPRDFLEGPYGYLALYEGGCDVEAARAMLAVPGRAIEELSIKPWPTGRAAHGALEMLAEIRATLDSTARRRIVAIVVTAPPLVLRLIGRPWQPDMRPSYARLCLPYLAATLLARGRVDLDDFSPTALGDRRRSLARIRLDLRPLPEASENALSPQQLVVRLDDGSEIRAYREALLGSPGRPLSAAARSAKVAHCLAHGAGHFPAAARKRLTDSVRRLATLPDLRELCAATVPEP